MPDPVASIPYIVGSETAPASRTPTNELDQDAFLKLLVAQLRYQNPMSPADPQSFLAQTAQFTTVEKLSELTEQFAQSDRLAQVATGSALVGRTINFSDPDGKVATGTVTSARPTADGCVVIVGDFAVPLDAVTAVF